MKFDIRSVHAGRIIIVVGLLGLTYLIGYATAQHDFFPSRYLERLESKATSVVTTYLVTPAQQEVRSITKDLQTVFVSLRVDELQVTLSRGGEGGGLTSFGNELLLLAHEGSVFRILDNAAEPTRVATPSNGFDDYVAAAQSDKYRDLEHKFAWFRYHDILYYSDGNDQGLVISYTEYIADKECFGTTVARLELPIGIESIMDIEATEDDWTIIHRTQPCLPLKTEWRAIEGHMAGGRIAYLKPNKVVLGSGDYHWDGVYAPESFAQRPDNDYGKVLEINLDNGISRTLSKGNRNMQGVLVDADGKLWVTEHGPRGGDELNRIDEGGNYGWPKNTLGTEYNLLPWPGAEGYGRHDQYTPPIYAWVPSIATSNLIQIEGFAPSWDGDLLVASLRAKSLFRLRMKHDTVIFAEPIYIGERIRYAHQHTDGRIVLWTDARKIMFVSLGAATNVYAGIEKYIDESEYDAPAKQKLKSAIETCARCHSLEANAHDNAPGLGAIFGSQIAATSYANYSEALGSRSGNWTADTLSQYLRDPQSFAPGTSMPDPAIDDPLVIDGILQILQYIKNEPL